jgi:hypothetical protein
MVAGDIVVSAIVLMRRGGTLIGKGRLRVDDGGGGEERSLFSLVI